MAVQKWSVPSKSLPRNWENELTVGAVPNSQASPLKSIPDTWGTPQEGLEQGCRTYFYRDHSSLVVAFKGSNVILGLYKWNYSFTRGKELGNAAGQKQGGGPDFSPRALCLTPVGYSLPPGTLLVHWLGRQQHHPLPSQNIPKRKSLKFINAVCFWGIVGGGEPNLDATSFAFGHWWTLLKIAWGDRRMVMDHWF